MRKFPPLSRRILSVASIATLIAVQAFPLMTPASAAQITNRTLTLVGGTSDINGDGINDGGSMPGGIVRHQFDFDVSGGSVGAIKFQYCTTAAPVLNGIDCDLPAGLDTTSVNLSADSTSSFTNTDNSTNGTVIISKAAAAVTPTTLGFQFSGVTNPGTISVDPNVTFFVRITTYSSTTATAGNEVDQGTVTASTAEPIRLEGVMPESLVFCTGETIGLNGGGVPDCTTATPGTISFDRLFSPTDTATATSQMAASTNAGAGYAITVTGPTMTSGSNTISSMPNTAVSTLGVSQFGMNLVTNTTPTVGTAIAPASNGTNYNGAPYQDADPTYDYGTPENFRYVDGATVAHSTAGTDAQIYTASYIVNVPGSQPAGTYTTTLTYICTATF